MANIFYLEPIDGGDNGIWGNKELNQNRVASGALSCQIYDDSGVLKVTVGKIHLNDGSGQGIVVVDTVVTVDISGITNSRWFAVEVSRTGTVPSFEATELPTDTNPYALPGNIDGYYSASKGGYYRMAAERIIGFGWKSSGGTLAGIVNVESIIEGYSGYSVGGIIGHKYRWNKRLDDTFDDNYVGRLYVLPNADRPSAWILNAGVATSFTDVDFSAYVPKNVKMLMVKWLIRWDGDGARDLGTVYFRANGSSETDIDKLDRLESYYENRAAGLTTGAGAQAHLICDSDGIIEYYVDNASTSLFLNLIGYWI